MSPSSPMHLTTPARRYKIEYEVDEDDFSFAMGRKPLMDAEWEDFCWLVKKGLDAQIDWDIIMTCAGHELRGGEYE